MKIRERKCRFNNVMLIDDNELDNFINEKTVEANYFSKKIYVHTSGKSALEFLTDLTRMGPEYAEVFPEVIFVDLNMPLMDGFQFIEQFKQTISRHLCSPKLIILTSSVYAEDRQRAKEISADILFFNKPLTANQLEQILLEK